jgi:hypothetical protein
MRALSVRARGEGIEPVPDSDPGGGAIPMQSRRYARVVRGRRTGPGLECGARSGRWSRTRETGAVRTAGAALIDDFTGRPVVRGRGRRLLWQIVRIFGQVCR